MSLILDLSPAIVNRTAVYNIAMDCMAVFREDGARLQYFGEIGPESPSAALLDRYRSRFGELLGYADRNARSGVMSWSKRQATSSDTKAPTFYLDPLYPLFADLSPDDVVMVHDLSPLTTPAWHRPAVSLLYDIAFQKIAQVEPRLIAVSQNTADTYVANFGYPRKPIELVYNYVPSHLRKQAEQANPVYSTSPYFLFVGSLEARKNITGAIESFRVSRLGEAGWRLLVVGGGGHGAEKVHALVNKTDGVVLAGFVPNDELGALYAGASGFIYPSYLEGFGVPLLEAMLYGLPAVASVTGACPEVGGPDVAYCDPDDHAAIADHLLRIAALSPTERANIAQRSRTWVQERFGVERWKGEIRRAVLKEGGQ